MLMPSRIHEAENFIDSEAALFAEELKTIDQAIGLREFSGQDPDYQRLKLATDSACAACLEVEEKIGTDKELLDDTRKRFREIIAPWFHQSPLFHHGITKPRGYAGDYQMLIAIYEGKVRSTGIGGYLDYYFLNTELAKAVVARMEGIQIYLENELKRRKKNVSVLDVACGPCQEYARGINLPNDNNVQITLLDYDRGALEYVENNVIKPRPDRSHFRCIRYNALRMRSAERFIQQYGKYDILYSVGLCDYIANQQLIPMLHGWREMVNEGGFVYVAFKDAELYTTPIYQWVTDWHFLQRTQDDCTQIMEAAGFDLDQLEISRDSSGVIMNYIARVAAPERVRTDRAHQHVAAPAHRNARASRTVHEELSPPEAQ